MNDNDGVVKNDSWFINILSWSGVERLNKVIVHCAKFQYFALICLGFIVGQKLFYLGTVKIASAHAEIHMVYKRWTDSFNLCILSKYKVKDPK